MSNNDRITESSAMHAQSTSVVARVIKAGVAEGAALVSTQALGFLGVVDPDSGLVTETTHELYGQSVAGKILVFPTGKGSTVGSYTIYRLKKSGHAPLAIINRESEPIVAVGAIISNIPMVDEVDISQIHSGDHVRVDGANVTISHEDH
jgi:predicted aconitase with swiveling domain